MVTSEQETRPDWTRPHLSRAVVCPVDTRCVNVQLQDARCRANTGAHITLGETERGGVCNASGPLAVDLPLPGD